MVFLNPDGGEAAMCGNGARCAAFFAYIHGIAGRAQRIQTGAGVVEAEIVEEAQECATVRIAFPEPAPPVERRIVAEGREWACQCLDTGVPHAVVFVDDAEAVDVVRVGRAIRHHGAFAPEGTNVDFVQCLDSTTLRIRTYERGVEDETGACGTGAVAAAVATPLTTNHCQLKTTSGATLVVGRSSRGLTLMGPAVIVFHGSMVL